MAADKARFYLEQSIPELQEYEKKSIFTKDEIAAITRKRSDFEHRINAPGCTPADFTRYATYEMNLEKLRAARVKRLGIRAKQHYGQRRIFFVLDRATRKFPGEVPLWMQYIEYAKAQKSGNVVAKALAAVLKLHPAKPELWIYAAAHAMTENADMTEARSHMQRGLRFNKRSKLLWREYAKLEMTFIAKVVARRRLLGIDAPAAAPAAEEEPAAGDDDEADELKLPTITAADLDPTIKTDRSLDALALENMATNPALNGAIPQAVFDAAMAEFPGDLALATDFFDLFNAFAALPCTPRLRAHVVAHMLAAAPAAPDALWTAARTCVLHTPPTSPAFPPKFAELLRRVADAAEKAAPRAGLYARFAAYLAQVYAEPELDEALRTAVAATLARWAKRAEREEETSPALYASWIRVLGGREGRQREAVVVAGRAKARWPKDPELERVVRKYGVAA